MAVLKLRSRREPFGFLPNQDAAITDDRKSDATKMRLSGRKTNARRANAAFARRNADQSSQRKARRNSASAFSGYQRP
jgi:hypothetical protein